MRRIIQSPRTLVNLMACLTAMAVVFVGTCATQISAQVTPTPANPQNPSTQSLQAGVEGTRLPVRSAIVPTTPASTAIQGVASIPSSTRPGSLRAAGRGLPGLSGGPPITGGLGYQDPAPRYMRPPTLGPLLCDPLTDSACD